MFIVAGGRQTGKTTRLLQHVLSKLNEVDAIHCYLRCESDEWLEASIKEIAPKLPVSSTPFSNVGFSVTDLPPGKRTLVLIENVEVTQQAKLDRLMEMLVSIEQETNVQIAITLLCTDRRLVSNREDVVWLSIPPKSLPGEKSKPEDWYSPTPP